MINRMKRIIDRSQPRSGAQAYFIAIQGKGYTGGPTFAEAQRDFNRITKRYSYFIN